MLKSPSIAVIGLGVIGQIHLKMARMYADKGDFAGNIAAVCDVAPGLAEKTAREFGIARAWSTPQDVFADPAIDGVVIALPAHLRTELGLQAFEAGKHVLTEKPVAMNAGEVRALIQARDRANAARKAAGAQPLIGACCSCRYHGLESAEIVRNVIRSGVLGELRVVRVRAVLAAPPTPPFNPPPVWRLRKDLNGGGILMNWGQYDCDFMFGLLDWRLKPQRALARTFGNIEHYATYAHPSSDAETHVVAFVDCVDAVNGKPVAFTYERAEFTTSATEEAWQIVGSDASLRLFMKEKPGKQLWIDKPTPKGTVSELLWEGEETFDQQHSKPIRDFAGAIRDRRAPATSLEQSLVIQSMFDAIYTSATSGEAVAIANQP